jgi:hypothetical protein
VRKAMASYVVPLAGALVVAAICVSRILERAGEPALPLDDSFIHLQYARRLAEGHWFAYAPGDGYTAGATSILWPLVLAPFFVVGLGDLSVVWVVWLFGALLHAAVALETARVIEPLASRGAAIAGGAMCLAFGAFAWFAYSGMETIALTWLLIRGVRVASERCEGKSSPWQMVVLAFAAPLVRPEGVLVALFAALVGARELWIRRKPNIELVCLISPLVVPAMHFVLAGQTASNTAIVKWLALDPYLDRSGFWQETLDNAHLLVTDLLAGGPWTTIFVPDGMVFALGAGMIAVVAAGIRCDKPWRALFAILLVLGTLLPCTYSTMLWNRVRYIWPFAPGWFVAIACAAHALGRWLGRLAAPLESAGAALAWGAVALFGSKLSWSMDDLAQSARAIALQQVALGRWARVELPDSAVIGVNDTGAIAYMSKKRTFDVVGLTTQGEARYWAEGAGSRFEHYESLDRSRLPTHFIVYPGWMQMPAVLGEELTEATVIDQSILGGRTMVAYVASWSVLGSGARPFAQWGKLLDELDVSDLESEATHAYQRADGRARFNVAASAIAPDGRFVADGGRYERAEDRFELALDRPSVMVIRARSASSLDVWLGAERLGRARLAASSDEFDEHAIDMPATQGRQVVVVRASEPARFASFHYWWFEK